MTSLRAPMLDTAELILTPTPHNTHERQVIPSGIPHPKWRAAQGPGV